MIAARVSRAPDEDRPACSARKMDELVRLLFHLLKPNSVALFASSNRGRALRLAALRSREENVARPGLRVPISGPLLAGAWSGVGEMWLREVSPRVRNVLPFYRDCTGIRSIRLIPFRLRNGMRYLLTVDYLDPPANDPMERIEPILRVFDAPPVVVGGGLCAGDGMRKVPIQIFCRRVLRPFVDSIPDFVTIRSLGLLLWEDRSPGAEILEVCGRSGGFPDAPGGVRFRIGPLEFRCVSGMPRRSPLMARDDGGRVHYFPVRLEGDIVGNLSLEIDAVRDDPEQMENLSRLVSWSLERELGMIRRLRGPGGEPDIDNPYQAVIRILDEWSNASRYNEYLSFGFVRLDLDGTGGRRESAGRRGQFHVGIRAEIESALRKGDIFLHGTGTNVALIFPRTPPEGAGSALRRLRNLLEGRVIRMNGTGVRVRSADFRVLSYPADLPTEEILLERCCPPVLPG